MKSSLQKRDEVQPCSAAACGVRRLRWSHPVGTLVPQVNIFYTVPLCSLARVSPLAATNQLSELSSIRHPRHA